MNSSASSPMAEDEGFCRFEQHGFKIINSLLEHRECDLFSAELTPIFEEQQKRKKSKIGGVRNLLGISSHVSQFSRSAPVLSLLKKFTGASMFPVRTIFFDKTPETNWLVSWHQDLSIAVRDRIEAPGFTGWSIKDKVLHVHPPREILEGMVTFRLHLDDCDVRNGALKVVPGSHRDGKLGSSDISKWTAAHEPVVCELAKGGALLMRPLLLHASSPAENPSHRRVLHLEYAAQELPNGLKWRDN